MRHISYSKIGFKEADFRENLSLQAFETRMDFQSCAAKVILGKVPDGMPDDMPVGRLEPCGVHLKAGVDVGLTWKHEGQEMPLKSCPRCSQGRLRVIKVWLEDLRLRGLPRGIHIVVKLGAQQEIVAHPEGLLVT